MSDSSDYDEDYFLRGRQTGKSLYEDYRWLPDLTIPMVARMISHCGIKSEDSILDFGCARGYIVKAFREMGYAAYGYDVSEWAIKNADPDVYHFLTRSKSIAFKPYTYNWIIAKDVLEHIPAIADTITMLMESVTTGLFVVVPLSATDGCPYVVPEYEEDITHVHRFTLATWAGKFIRSGWSVSMCYKVQGIKENYANYEKGNGFLIVRRI